jgi:hypothetical protein
MVSPHGQRQIQRNGAGLHGLIPGVSLGCFRNSRLQLRRNELELKAFINYDGEGRFHTHLSCAKGMGKGGQNSPYVHL